jgi:DNA anti-recombination protein RmuC
MGLGGTAKKLQKVMESAEKLYAKMNEIIGELKALQQEVEDTSQQVDHLERDLAEQRALVEALAETEGIDVGDVLASADLPPEPDAETDDETAKDDSEDPTGTENAGDATDVPVSDESGET